MDKFKISIIYIGDIRGNHEIMTTNHSLLITELEKICELEILDYTKKSKLRIVNPFDIIGFGGAIQVWDLVHAIECAKGNIVLKLRTDIWFTEKIINVIVNCIKRIISNNIDIFYIGSDLIATSHVLDGWEGAITADTTIVTDYVFISRKDKIRSKNLILQQLTNAHADEQRTGNIPYLWLVKDSNSITGRAKVILDHVWLIRTHYEKYPDDWTVFCDYFQRTISSRGSSRDTVNNISDNIQQVVDWYRLKRGWKPMKIDFKNVERWQSE